VDFLLQDIMHAPFWLAALKIIFVNIILSGDNAVVIAMACLTLPPRQRLWGMILGAGVAVLLRVIFTLIIAEAMTYPYLKLIGGALLFYVAIKLVTEDADGDEGGVESAQTLWRAVRIVAIADIVMSLDNVIAIAAASDGSITLLVLGLLISIPLILFSSTLLLRVIERFPLFVYAGAGLLGYIAGETLVTDQALLPWIEQNAPILHQIVPTLAAAVTVAIGWLAARRADKRKPARRPEIGAEHRARDAERQPDTALSAAHPRMRR
jgi:YjbE family integral membrane protein